MEISRSLRSLREDDLDELRSLLRIGIQWDTQVTLDDLIHHLSQAYCFVVPVAYTDHSPEPWEGFARLVLEGSYEAMVCAATLNRRLAGNESSSSSSGMCEAEAAAHRLD